MQFKVSVNPNPNPNPKTAFFNLFAPEPPVTPVCPGPRLSYRLNDVISFYCQGQLCPLTCAEWRDLLSHTRMSTIQSRTPEKKAKNHVTLTWKFPWKSCSTTHLPFLSPDPKILKGFLKTFLTKMKPTKCPARERKKKQGEERKRKVKVKTAVSLLDPKTLSLLRRPNFHVSAYI